MSINIRVNNKASVEKATHIAIIGNSIAALKPFDVCKDNMGYIQERIKDNENTLLHFHYKGQQWVIVLQGKKEDNGSYHLESIRGMGSDLCKLFNKEKAINTVFVNTTRGFEEEELGALLEGVTLMNYQYLKYKTDKKPNTLKKIELMNAGTNQSFVSEISNVLASTELARDLINEPVLDLTAEKLSKEIVKAGKNAGFTTKVLNKAAIEKLKMGGLLGVNAGSIDPPTFNILEWKPEKFKNKKPVILVGKGVVYDTGGNNLKTGGYMSTMKSDMGGAAAVIGAMNAVASNKLPLHVIGLIPATDNRIGKNAIVADDVLTMYDGTTVEVQKTDAEGRLILADALAYAKKYKPSLVIDLATLTGAAAHITGTFGTAMMGTAEQGEKLALTKVGDQVYERVAEMPYWKEYNDLLKSDIADVKNIGGPIGGAITAGKFLERFTDYPWIHLDIAGPAFITKPEKYKPTGGTGVGVRLLYYFLKSKTDKK